MKSCAVSNLSVRTGSKWIESGYGGTGSNLVASANTP